MNDVLIECIAEERPEVMQSIFEGAFQSFAGWMAALNSWPLKRDLSTVLAEMHLLPGEFSCAQAFQRIYLACWIYKPVEKGTFMIRLDAKQYEGVKAAFDKLSSRWSSHLSGNRWFTGERPRSGAGSGYQFLKGYSELLVQLEEDSSYRSPFLFLKTEGHSPYSLAHVASYFEKRKTGRGNVQNEALHDYAVRGGLGISERAAENFDKPYEALLAQLGLTGSEVTAAVAIPAICEKLAAKAQDKLVNPEVWNRFKERITVSPLARYDSGLLAGLIKQVILPTIRQDFQTLPSSKNIQFMMKAGFNLESLANALEEDARNYGYIPRVFEEVRVDPGMLSRSLQQFKMKLSRARAQSGRGEPGAWSQDGILP